MVRFSKHVVMLILLIKVVVLGYNKVCNQTLSIKNITFIWG